MQPAHEADTRSLLAAADTHAETDATDAPSEQATSAALTKAKKKSKAKAAKKAAASAVAVADPSGVVRASTPQTDRPLSWLFLLEIIEGDPVLQASAGASDAAVSAAVQTVTLASFAASQLQTLEVQEVPLSQLPRWVSAWSRYATSAVQNGHTAQARKTIQEVVGRLLAQHSDAPKLLKTCAQALRTLQPQYAEQNWALVKLIETSITAELPPQALQELFAGPVPNDADARDTASLCLLRMVDDDAIAQTLAARADLPLLAWLQCPQTRLAAACVICRARKPHPQLCEALVRSVAGNPKALVDLLAYAPIGEPVYLHLLQGLPECMAGTDAQTCSHLIDTIIDQWQKRNVRSKALSLLLQPMAAALCNNPKALLLLPSAGALARQTLDMAASHLAQNEWQALLPVLDFIQTGRAALSERQRWARTLLLEAVSHNEPAFLIRTLASVAPLQFANNTDTALMADIMANTLVRLQTLAAQEELHLDADGRYAWLGFVTAVTGWIRGRQMPQAYAASIAERLTQMHFLLPSFYNTGAPKEICDLLQMYLFEQETPLQHLPQLLQQCLRSAASLSVHAEVCENMRGSHRVLATLGRLYRGLAGTPMSVGAHCENASIMANMYSEQISLRLLALLHGAEIRSEVAADGALRLQSDADILNRMQNIAKLVLDDERQVHGALSLPVTQGIYTLLQQHPILADMCASMCLHYMVQHEDDRKELCFISPMVWAVTHALRGPTSYHLAKLYCTKLGVPVQQNDDIDTSLLQPAARLMAETSATFALPLLQAAEETSTDVAATTAHLQKHVTQLLANVLQHDEQAQHAPLLVRNIYQACAQREPVQDAAALVRNAMHHWLAQPRETGQAAEQARITCFNVCTTAIAEVDAALAIELLQHLRQHIRWIPQQELDVWRQQLLFEARLPQADAALPQTLVAQEVRSTAQRASFANQALAAMGFFPDQGQSLAADVHMRRKQVLQKQALVAVFDDATHADFATKFARLALCCKGRLSVMAQLSESTARWQQLLRAADKREAVLATLQQLDQSWMLFSRLMLDFLAGESGLLASEAAQVRNIAGQHPKHLLRMRTETGDSAQIAAATTSETSSA